MSEKKKRRRWTASGEAAGGAGRAGRLGGDQRAVPPGGDQPDAVLRLEEATADVRRRRCSPTAGSRSRRRTSSVWKSELRRAKDVDRGDHGGEPRPKKGALGLEDHGQLPPELQREVQAVVRADEASQRLAGAADLAALGRVAGELLPVAAGIAARRQDAGAAAAGAGLRSDGRGEASGAEPTP